MCRICLKYHSASKGSLFFMLSIYILSHMFDHSFRENVEIKIENRLLQSATSSHTSWEVTHFKVDLSLTIEVYSLK